MPKISNPHLDHSLMSASRGRFIGGWLDFWWGVIFRVIFSVMKMFPAFDLSDWYLLNRDFDSVLEFLSQYLDAFKIVAGMFTCLC